MTFPFLYFPLFSSLRHRPPLLSQCSLDRSYLRYMYKHFVDIFFLFATRRERESERARERHNATLSFLHFFLSPFLPRLAPALLPLPPGPGPGE